MKRTNITETSMELIQSPPKKLSMYVINAQLPFSFTKSTNQCKALYVILNRSDVDSFLGALDLLHESFSNIFAQNLHLLKPNFVMPELLLKELCCGRAITVFDSDKIMKDPIVNGKKRNQFPTKRHKIMANDFYLVS